MAMAVARVSLESRLLICRALFQEQLAELPCGVYVAWAGVRGEIHKCVCNIGFSPTFAGAENPEKIVEAHIMESFENDFYGGQ